MAILERKGFKVVDGTTLIKDEVLDNQKGGDREYRLYKFAQTTVSRQVHKALRDLAWERNVTLGELLADIIKTYLNKENSHGRNTSKGRTKESQEAY